MEIDWLELWRELIIANQHTPSSESIQRYKTSARQRRQRPDPLLDFVLNSIDRKTTVLDIGAGDGRLTVPLARIARTVTALEPAGDMLEGLRENIKTSQVNVQIIQSSWEEADVEDYDIVVCAHAMYTSPDLALFVHKMEQHARKACYMVIRLPPVDGVIGELSKAIFGRLHDSANAVVAYNALYFLGVYVNVMVENDIYCWVNNTLEEAFIRAKRHLHLESTSAHDGLIRDTLNKRLIFKNNCYIWPDGMRSALLWWNPSTISKQVEP
jgi:2-polyprenyl-3-methyl-5-hydroxy-6-metoxy-1,4-benzoquinol methylase